MELHVEHRMKILMVTHRLPYAPNRGDRIRAYHMLRFLKEYADVHLLSLVHDDEEEHHRDECPVNSVRTVRVPHWRNRLAALAALPTQRPLTHVLLDSSGLQSAFDATLAQLKPDIVVSYCTGVAHLLANVPSSVPCVVDMVDVDSLKWQQLSATANPLLGWVYARESRCLGSFERAIVRRAAITLVVNERERQALRAAVPDADIQVIPNGIDVVSFRPRSDPAPSNSVVFCGVLDYPPNEQAAVWLGAEIWPAVRERCPAATLTLVGANPTTRVRRLAANDSSILVTGSVPDVRPYLWRAAVSVAPLRTARGIQNKVLEALAAGLPVVTTSVVLTGLPECVHSACIQADSAPDAAAAIAKLLNETAEQRRAFAGRAGLESVAWDQQLAPLLVTLENLRHPPMDVVA
jgi:polysaccharide biosynthesis protein PslH